jgi:catechol 2,3-dioxygenase-like lactoylglutathione lyase family enzyme
VLGRFHEISLPTGDIRGSIAFYEQLGFIQASTGEAWPHPYAVMTDGRLALGLHQARDWQPSLTYVHPQIARHAPALQAHGLELEFAHLGDDRFNELGLRDPAGQLVRLVEARTYSPTAPVQATSLCGLFAHFSMPVADRSAAQGFWESLGFVALESCARPYPHLPLTSDHLEIAFHEPRISREPMLVFEAPMSAGDGALLPRRASGGAFLQAPEATLLFLADAD